MRRELRERGAGGTLSRNAFWRISKARERFLHLYADALSSSNSVLCHIWGQGPQDRGLGALAPMPKRSTDSADIKCPDLEMAS